MSFSSFVMASVAFLRGFESRSLVWLRLSREEETDEKIILFIRGVIVGFFRKNERVGTVKTPQALASEQIVTGCTVNGIRKVPYGA